MRWVFPFSWRRLVVRSCRVGAGRLRLCAGSAVIQVRAPQPGRRLKQTCSLPRGSATILKSLLPFAAIAGLGGVHRSHWGRFWPALMPMRAGICQVWWAASSGGLLEVRPGSPGLGRRGLLLLWLEERRRPEDEPPGYSRRTEEHRRQSAEQGQNPQNAAPDARRRQMIKATETATVVITNPTHYAVALRFEMSMAAPIVVAKGLDLLARRSRRSPGPRHSGDGKPAAGAGALQDR
jgi:hypothetical protein